MRRWLALSLVVSAAAVFACTFDPKIDANGFACQTNADCPASYRCDLATASGPGVCCNRPIPGSCLAPAGAGGVLGTGGVLGAGAAPGIGGVVGTGGMVGSGGLRATGGLAGFGGITGRGGLSGLGGASGRGGVSSTGGIVGAGGTSGAGGTTVPELAFAFDPANPTTVVAGSRVTIKWQYASQAVGVTLIWNTKMPTTTTDGAGWVTATSGVDANGKFNGQWSASVNAPVSGTVYYWVRLTGANNTAVCKPNILTGGEQPLAIAIGDTGVVFDPTNPTTVVAGSRVTIKWQYATQAVGVTLIWNTKMPTTTTDGAGWVTATSGVDAEGKFNGQWSASVNAPVSGTIYYWVRLTGAADTAACKPSILTGGEQPLTIAVM